VEVEYFEVFKRQVEDDDKCVHPLFTIAKENID
jgi:hypothetical protein